MSNQPYERNHSHEFALSNTHRHMWFDGSKFHKIKTCDCDKCLSIKQAREKKREEYRKSYRKENSKKIMAYQNGLRDIAKSLGRPRSIQLKWEGSPWLDEDYEFWKAAMEFAERVYGNPSKMVRVLVEEAMKKEVRS